MTTHVYNPESDVLTVKAGAIDHFRKQLLADTNAVAVRVSVKESGCTGFMYVVDLVAQVPAGDLKLQVADDVLICVDRTHLNVLAGTELDYVLEGVNRQLQFNNPNAQDHCGCGESFNVVSSRHQ
jgi:iron-sulfur cluster assembly accessory protein